MFLSIDNVYAVALRMADAAPLKVEEFTILGFTIYDLAIGVES